MSQVWVASTVAIWSITLTNPTYCTLKHQPNLNLSQQLWVQLDSFILQVGFGKMFPTRLLNRSSLVFSNSCYLLWLTQTITSPSCSFNPPNGVNLPHCTDWTPLIFFSQLINELGYGSYWLHTCYSPESAQPESYCPDPVPPLFQQTNSHNFKKWCT